MATVALLIKKRADVNNRIKVANIDIFHKDMHYSLILFVSFLQCGLHALYSASFEGKLECVKLLLDGGAQNRPAYQCELSL